MGMHVKKKTGNMKKKTTKTVRVDIEDWLYLYRMVGDDEPMKVAVKECIKAHKEMEDIEGMELPFDDEEE